MAISIPDLTLDQLPKVRTVDLVAFYNRKTGKAILKFQDRKTAEARCAEIIRHPSKIGKLKPVERQVVTDASPENQPKLTAPARSKKRAEPEAIKKSLRNVQAAIKAITPFDALVSSVTATKAPRTRAAGEIKRGPKPKWDLASTITLIQTKNPKREGTLAHDEYEFYRTARTVGEYVSFGGQLAYLNYDESRGFIKITAPK